MTMSQLEGAGAGIRKVATKVTTTLNCLEGAVQGMGVQQMMQPSMMAMHGAYATPQLAARPPPPPPGLATAHANVILSPDAAEFSMPAAPVTGKAADHAHADDVHPAEGVRAVLPALHEDRRLEVGREGGS